VNTFAAADFPFNTDEHLCTYVWCNAITQ
jgi:hypothetical protein